MASVQPPPTPPPMISSALNALNTIFISFKTYSWQIFKFEGEFPSFPQGRNYANNRTHAPELIVIQCSPHSTPYYLQVNYASNHTALGPTSTWVQSKY